ncbi:MAG: choline dehydrogenase [Gaiellaceae bacterium]|nr:choline dehydrogenase [Gaiellaceae bacterium]
MPRLTGEGPFSGYLPVRIRFGDGVAAELPQLLADAGLTRPFVVLDPNVPDPPVPAGATVYEIARHEPTCESVEACGVALRESGCDVVVAIGGGSALDTAKGARVVAHCGAPIRRFCWPGETVEPIPPSPYRLVTIPTTSGTGSEVTGGAVMYHEGHKVSGAHPNNRADWALVDPLLTHGLPPLPTLYTAADALAQALAAVVVTARTPIGDAVGLEATRICGLAMRAVVREPDAAARNQMALGSMMAGLAMNISEDGTEHALGEPLGTLYHLPHGLTIGLVLAESMDVDRRAVPERFERIADALGAPADGTRDGSRAVRAVREILAETGFPTMRESGVRNEDVEQLAVRCREAWIPVEPAPWTHEDIVSAYRAGLAIERR